LLEFAIGSGLGAPAIAQKRVLHDGCTIVDGQLRLGVEKELTPEWLEFLWNLVHARQTVGSQRSSHFANPSSNAITSHRKAGASVEERLASELVVNTGSGQVKKELVAVCKEKLARIIILNERKRTLVREVGIRLDIVRSSNMLRDGEGVRTMGGASLVAVVAQHPGFTMLAIAIAKDTV
jgi:hypothetical protein